MAAPRRYRNILSTEQIQFLAIVQCSDFHLRSLPDKWLMRTPFFGDVEILQTEVELLESLGLLEWNDGLPVLSESAAQEIWDDGIMIRQALFDAPGSSEDQILQYCNKKFFNNCHIMPRNRVVVWLKDKLVPSGKVILRGREQYHRSWWPAEFCDRIQEVLKSGQSFTTSEILIQIKPYFPLCQVSAVQQYLMLLFHGQQGLVKELQDKIAKQLPQQANQEEAVPSLMQALLKHGKSIPQNLKDTFSSVQKLWKTNYEKTANELQSLVDGWVKLDHQSHPSRWAVAASF